MKKVTIYPFNKITQGLIRFRDLLDFQIVSVLDFAMDIGKDAGELTDGKISGIKITDCVDDALKGVDALILNDPGTVFAGNEEIFKQHHLVERWKDLVQKSNHAGVEVISVHEIFDFETKKWMSENNIAITIGKKFNQQMLDNLEQLTVNDDSNHREIYEYIKSMDIDRKIKEPTKIKKIAIMGSRGCLGKFTTQMSLYRVLKNSGKKVLPLITEPTAFLFGQCDADIPKFLSMNKTLLQYPYYINELVRKAESDGFDYVILSGQGSLLPYKKIKLDAIKMATLEAFNPDVTLLVTGYDEQEISDCIDLLRIYGNHNPLAILVPDKVEMCYGNYDFKTQDQITNRIQEIKNKCGIQHVELIQNIDKIAELI